MQLSRTGRKRYGAIGFSGVPGWRKQKRNERKLVG
jgi:hypothetical protein